MSPPQAPPISTMKKEGMGTIQRTADSVRRAVMSVIKTQRIPRMVEGTVSAASGQTCTFTQSGTSTPQADIACYLPYTPTNGDVALGMYVDGDLILFCHH